MKILITALVLVGLVTGSAGSVLAFNFTFAPGEYDNTANTVTGTNASPVYNVNQTTGNFRDVFWWGTAFNGGTAGVGSPDFINSGQNMVTEPGTNHAAPLGNNTALNFTGLRTSGGASLLSIYDTTPNPLALPGPGQNAAGQNVFSASVPGGLTLSADILFAPGGHNVSGGIVAAYNEGHNGLALLANNGGGNNPDVPKVSLIFQHNGAPTTLASVSLAGTSFVGDTNAANTSLGDHWYRIIMNLSVDANGTLTETGSFFSHSDPEDPNSPLGSLIASLNYSGAIAVLDLTNPGEVGLMAFTPENFNDNCVNVVAGACPNPGVDSMGVSFTNFTNVVPEPATMFLGGVGLILLGYAARRRLFAR